MRWRANIVERMKVTKDEQNNNDLYKWAIAKKNED